jgi:catechol 2,3-dioxygenase-like lactoylglutathione lyase family enzyme
MADRSPFATSGIHHVALRVEDVEGTKNWLVTVLGFRVEREFQFAGNEVVLLSPGGAKVPVIELIGGPVENDRQLPGSVLDIVKRPGWHHVCLQVSSVEECMSDLRHREVKILLDVTDGVPEIGVEKIAFISDPWGNVYELLQLADER